MKNFIVWICVFAMFVASMAVMAADVFTPSAVAPSQTVASQKKARDDAEEASQLRDMMIAYSVVGLTRAVKALADNCKNPDSPDCVRAVVDADKLDKPAENPKAAKLTPAQRAQVKWMLDRAIPMASQGQIEGLSALAERVGSLETKVADHEVRITKLEKERPQAEIPLSVDETLSLSRRLVVMEADLAATKDDQKAIRAIAEEAKVAAEEAQANGGGASQSDLIKVAEVAGDAQGRADVAMARVEEALEVAKAKAESGGPLNPAELAELEAKLDEAKSEIKVVKKIAQSAHDIASQKQDAGLLEVGLVGQFSPAVKGLMLEGTYWIRKAKVRVGIAGGLGLALDDDPVEFMFDTRIKFGYEFHPNIWGGLYIATYGSGMPFQHEFGYGGGAFIRGVIPLTKEMDLFIEGFVGPAYEYAWVPADPPEGIADGSTFNSEQLAGELVPMGGASVGVKF